MPCQAEDSRSCPVGTSEQPAIRSFVSAAVVYALLHLQVVFDNQSPHCRRVILTRANTTGITYPALWAPRGQVGRITGGRLITWPPRRADHPSAAPHWWL